MEICSYGLLEKKNSTTTKKKKIKTNPQTHKHTVLMWPRKYTHFIAKEIHETNKAYVSLIITVMSFTFSQNLETHSAFIIR